MYFGHFSGSPTGGALRHPILVGFESEPDPPAVGEIVQWTITFTNLIDVDLVVGVGRYRLGSSQVLPGPWQPLGVPVDLGDGDDIVSMRESLRWEVTHTVEAEGSYVEVDSNYGMATVPSGLMLSGRSDQPVEPAPTTTTTPTTTTPTTTTAATVPIATTSTPAVASDVILPETGSTRTPAATAVALVTAGALLLVLARRRTRQIDPHPPA